MEILKRIIFQPVSHTFLTQYKIRSRASMTGHSPVPPRGRILQHATRNAAVWGAVGNAAKISPALLVLKQAELRRHACSAKKQRNLKNRESPWSFILNFRIDLVYLALCVLYPLFLSLPYILPPFLLRPRLYPTQWARRSRICRLPLLALVWAV